MGPTWGPSGADRTQVGPMLAPWTLLFGFLCLWILRYNPHSSMSADNIGRGSVIMDHKNGCAEAKLPVTTDSLSIIIRPTEMISIHPEKCCVADSLEFVGRVNCRCGQSNMPTLASTGPKFDSLWPSDAIWWERSGSTSGQVNGLLPDSTKLLSEPVLTYHQKGSVARTREQFHMDCSRIKPVTWIIKLCFWNYYHCLPQTILLSLCVVDPLGRWFHHK